MTENPVAAANARHQMEARDTGDAGDLVEAQGPARWLSTYQSAFWAGFMDDRFPWKQRIMTVRRALHLTILAHRLRKRELFRERK